VIKLQGVNKALLTSRAVTLFFLPYRLTFFFGEASLDTTLGSRLARTSLSSSVGLVSKT
jgi:hypothetical protein